MDILSSEEEEGTGAIDPYALIPMDDGNDICIPHYFPAFLGSSSFQGSYPGTDRRGWALQAQQYSGMRGPGSWHSYLGWPLDDPEMKVIAA